MPRVIPYTNPEMEQLRREHYNADVVKIIRAHADLMIIRIRPDHRVPSFLAGQYTVLGLGPWERRVEGVEDEPSGLQKIGTLIKRAYSMSSSMIGDGGQLVRVSECPYLEFYVSLVRHAEEHPPALTPRLFALTEGDRLFCGPHVHGNYTLGQISPENDIVFAATGTGEAPHNAMLTELLAGGHRGRIASTTCVRRMRDLAYLSTHREIERRYTNYRYLTLTTREPENIDPKRPGYVGKQYLQDYFVSGDFERDARFELSPHNTHVFLCGNPDMIGVPRLVQDARRYPHTTGMVRVLQQRGFLLDQPHEPGNVHIERFW